jgi:tryptophan synthase beta chain
MDGLIEPRAVYQLETFNAGVTWARTEGFISAPETNHALAAVIQEAKKAKEEGKEKTILVNWSGHGLVDLAAYDAFFQGKLTDYELPQEEIAEALKAIENFPKPKL